MTKGVTTAQVDALNMLKEKLSKDTYLAGGVAVALRERHRVSRDLDLFCPEVDSTTLSAAFSRLPDVEITSRAEGTLYLRIHGIPISLLQYDYPLLNKPEELAAVPIPVASEEDLICMKLSAIAGRGTLRDFWDLHALLSRLHMPLENAMQLYKRKFTSEDIGHVVRSLVYFGEAEQEPRPDGLDDHKWQHIKDQFRRWVTNLPSNL